MPKFRMIFFEHIKQQLYFVIHSFKTIGFLSLMSLFFVLLGIASCEKEKKNFDPSTVSVNLLEHSQCKTFKKKVKYDSNQDCIEYNYQDNTLYFTHYNAGFNCCAGTLSVSYEIQDHTIIITEKQEKADCDSLCLYDLEMKIQNLPRGEYHIKIVEPYVNVNIPLEFTIDLTTETTGSFCQERNFYPWGI